MRCLFTVSIFLGLCTLVCAQQQERKLMERIDAKWDMSQINHMDGKKFSFTSGNESRSFNGGKNGYTGVKDANIKEYAWTRKFLGIKNPWLGAKVFDTDSAYVPNGEAIPNADRKVDIKKARVSEYAQADKKSPFDPEKIPTKPFLGQGKSQGSLNQMGEKMNKELTIDQVRDLLNKDR